VSCDVQKLIERERRRLRAQRRDVEVALGPGFSYASQRAALEMVGQISHSLETLARLAKQARRGP
jgi:hypothetical protein